MGFGITTLGRALAEYRHCPHFDTDAYYWLSTDPPFTQPRELAERQQRLMTDLTAHDAWVLSGSLCGWGDIAIPLFELVIFLWIPQDVRLARIRRREVERYGKRIMPGGDMYARSQAFLSWAASYDTADETIRSRRLHDQWLSTLSCPIVRLECVDTTQEQIDVLMAQIAP